jgi:hypothetical protein
MFALHRRAFLQASAACACGLYLPAAAHGQPASLREVKGCRLTSRDQGLLSGRGLKLGASFEEVAETGGRRTTGSPEMDRALDRAIKRLADTFGVFPGFGFFNDEPYKNAYALDYTLPELPHTKGTVVYGDLMFSYLMGVDPTGTAVMWVMAHEFAHIWLYSTGDLGKLGPEGEPRSTKRMELHADYLAGFYVGQRQRANRSISLYKTGSEIWKIGDKNYDDPAHHGTAPERLAAAESGFKISFLQGRDASYAYSAGLDYVLSM